MSRVLEWVWGFVAEEAPAREGGGLACVWWSVETGTHQLWYIVSFERGRGSQVWEYMLLVPVTHT